MAPDDGGPPCLDSDGKLSDAIALSLLRDQRQSVQRQMVVERSLSVANGPQFSQRMT